MSVFDNYQCEGQLTLGEIYGQDIWSGKTYPEPSAQTKERTSDVSLKKRSGSLKKMPLFLDLRGGQKWSPSGAILGDGWSIAWRVHDAQFWGVPQRRKRISLVADFGGSSAPEILFERKSLSGDSEQGGEERKRTSGDAEDDVIETISFQERAGCEGGARESSFSTNEQERCQPSIINRSCKDADALCIGVDAYNQSETGKKAMSITGAATDPHHIPCVTVSQDAYDKYTENEKSASLKQSGGNLGGGSETLVIQ